MWFNPSDFKKTAEDPAAIFAIHAVPESQNSKTAKIATPSLRIPEIENSRIAGIANRTESNNAAFSVIDSVPSEKMLPVPDEDDRHHCRECQNLRNGYCNKQRFRPVDDIPRRCESFSGYPDRISSSASNTKPAPVPKSEFSLPICAAPTPIDDPLLVEVYTPSGIPMTIRADNAERAAWLRQMNPKPENPAPKPPEPKPDANRISEAVQNAHGRFFKWLITRPNGSQFYSCSMPRQTLAEVRTQYPDATHIQPVEGEDYPHD